jgi:glycosyltransferase involved in cell wall biosynthesis
VFPSLQEGLPVALMEAMAAELPIICSKIRGNTDLIVDGEGGYLVEAKDVDGYAHAIDRLVDNYESLDNMRKTNVEIMKNFDVSKVRDKMTELYGDLLNNK